MDLKFILNDGVFELSIWAGEEKRRKSQNKKSQPNQDDVFWL